VPHLPFEPPFEPLLVAVAFLAAGFVGSRFTFRNHPIGRFVVQLASFVGFSIALLVAGIIPSEPTAATVETSGYAIISIFKIIWWLAASWLVVGLFHAVAKKQSKRQPVNASA
jgi:hypothetical protein